VPRTWSLVWLAGAHRDPPDGVPAAWRARWAAEAERHGQAPLPERFNDDPNAGRAIDPAQEAAEATSRGTIEIVSRLVLPAIIRVGLEGRWFDPLVPAGEGLPPVAPVIEPTVVDTLDRAMLDRLAIAPWTLPIANPAAARNALAGLLDAGGSIAAAVAGDVVVGVAAVAPAEAAAPADELLALGVAPAFRRAGLAAALLAAIVARQPEGHALRAVVAVGERDARAPLDRGVRASVARRLLTGAGFRVRPAAGPLGRYDPEAIEAVRPGR
jgi:GNAT superfamily N-acetyltransferase